MSAQYQTTDLTAEKNFLWRAGKHAFHYLLPNGAVLSCIWTWSARRGNYPWEEGTFSDLRQIAGRFFDESAPPEHKTRQEVIEIVRAAGTVEIAAFWWPDGDWLHPDDWGDYVRGWQNAEDAAAFIDWLQAQKTQEVVP